MTVEQRAREAGASLRAATETAVDVMEALDQTKATRRRRQRSGRLAGLVVGAALVAVALVTAPRLSANPGSTTPGDEAPSPSASSGPMALPYAGALLAAGTYLVPSVVGDIAVTVPKGWETAGEGLLGPAPSSPTTKAGVWVFDVSNIYTDPCNFSVGPLTPQVGPEVTDLVQAFTESTTYHAVAAGSATIDGYRGLRVRLTVPASIAACHPHGVYSMWIDGAGFHRYETDAGEQDELWIIDVDGARLVIDEFWLPGASKADRAELEQVIASIRIHP